MARAPTIVAPLLLLALAGGCAGDPAREAPPRPLHHAPAALHDDPAASVRFVHGSPPHGVPGPFALAGWRIGRDALARLGASRERPWDLVVTHRSPPEVRWTCVMDGLAASTGASLGKLNLRFEPVAVSASAAGGAGSPWRAEGRGMGMGTGTGTSMGMATGAAGAGVGAPVVTVIEHRKSGRVLEYRLAPSYVEAMGGVDYADFPAAARKLEGMRDEEVFVVSERAGRSP